MLRERYTVVTCSNGPCGMLAKLCKFNDLRFDLITPLELRKVYKPNLQAYWTVFDVLGVEPSEVMMVTANEKFGDLEAAAELGMQSKLIRNEWNGQMTIEDLAEELANGG